MKDYRTRNRYFCAILYEDDSNFTKYKNNIIKNYEEETYIKHDRDINENGEYKKPHYHFLFKVGQNARHIKTIAKEIQIEENYLQGCQKIPMLKYLIHKNNPDKTQYNVEEVQGELKEKLKELIDNEIPEEEKLEPILYYIKERIYTYNNTTNVLRNTQKST